MDSQRNLHNDREWELAKWEDDRKDREQAHKHKMAIMYFFSVVVPLTIWLTVVISRNKDANVGTVATALSLWVSATIFERRVVKPLQGTLKPLERIRQLVNEQQEKSD